MFHKIVKKKKKYKKQTGGRSNFEHNPQISSLPFKLCALSCHWRALFTVPGMSISAHICRKRGIECEEDCM
ncbi:hypothetical protein AZ46_0207920 [Metabacillus indicus LMG 22858]|nr:hypothetical protein AZ46_0207920 [Metabacillus indicus LMG 22858]